MNAMKIDKDFVGKNAKFKKKATKGEIIYALFIVCLFISALVTVSYFEV